MEPLGDNALLNRLRVQARRKLGDVLTAAGCYAEARPHLTTALAESERDLGPDDLDTVAVRNSLGTLCKHTGCFDESHGHYVRALAALEQHFGPDHPELAALLQEQGRYEDAEVLSHHAQAVFERVYGPEHSEVAINLAVPAHARNNGSEAERPDPRALTLKEHGFGQDHPSSVPENPAVPRDRAHFLKGLLFVP
jgi:hypothetical protein